MKRVIIILSFFLVILVVWFYGTRPATDIAADTVLNHSANAAHSDALAQGADINTQISNGDAQSSDASVAVSEPGLRTTSIYYPEKFAADGSLLPLLERRREYSRKEIREMLKTPEELQRDWWHEYSRQVPRLRVKGECNSPGSNVDIRKLHIAAEAGDRCAMGYYANAKFLRWANDNVYADPEKLRALLPEVEHLQEYYALSAVTFRFAAVGRACVAINYFNDIEEALAWRMINYAYWNNNPPVEICRVNEVMSDKEVVYQRALELALLYIDFYQLAKW